jgi:hypothetical protein
VPELGYCSAIEKAEPSDAGINLNIGDLLLGTPSWAAREIGDDF